MGAPTLAWCMREQPALSDGDLVGILTRGTKLSNESISKVRRKDYAEARSRKPALRMRRAHAPIKIQSWQGGPIANLLNRRRNDRCCVLRMPEFQMHTAADVLQLQH